MLVVNTKTIHFPRWYFQFNTLAICKSRNVDDIFQVLAAVPTLYPTSLSLSLFLSRSLQINGRT